MIEIGPAPEDWSGLEDLRADVERTLRRSCRDANELDDLVQETFMRAARFRSGLQSCERLRSWVLRIAWNVLRDHIRRQRRARTVEVGDEFLLEVEGREPTPGEAPQERFSIGGALVDRAELAQLLVDLMPGLRAEERTLLEGYYVEGLGCAGAGAGLGISPEQAKMRLFRLRKRLRRELLRRTSLRRRAIEAGREVVA
jgi:RNA polymerase sigma-70 factor (ECF subfamily)